MRIRTILWGLSMGCAAMLVSAPFTPRTTWVATYRGAGGATITEGVGWHGVAAVVGIVAMIALLAPLVARRRAALVGSALATVGFVIIAVGMARHAIDLTNGVTSINPGAGWEYHPAPIVLLFARIAAVGAVCSAALTSHVLQHPGRETTIVRVDG